MSDRRTVGWAFGVIGACAVFTLLVVASARVEATAPTAYDDLAESVLRGRVLVFAHGCADCHGGLQNPNADGFLAGGTEPETVGPFKVWPSNITPDDETGIGRYSERQIFNALRYGLRPSGTPDVEITSSIPGEGNHPAQPNYLAPAMPWLWFRYSTDQELRDMAAYLKHGLQPVRNAVPAPGAPPDNWAAEFTVEKIGTHVLPAFPTEHEALSDESRRDEVLAGRHLVNSLACAACHGGVLHAGQQGWLIGSNGEGPLQKFQIGPFATYPRNLTPDNLTGLGRFTERQLFNALRYGLRPGETPDVEITSTVPGEGNHPAQPKYLAIPMPWHAFRHLSDEDLRAVVAYMKLGVKPVRHRVQDSEGPPDFWASEYTPEKLGTWPAPPFPAARERMPGATAVR